MRFMVRKNGSCPDLFAGNHLLTVHAKACVRMHRRSQGGQRGHAPSNF